MYPSIDLPTIVGPGPIERVLNRLRMLRSCTGGYACWLGGYCPRRNDLGPPPRLCDLIGVGGNGLASRGAPVEFKV